jgi:hypothetical protein
MLTSSGCTSLMGRGRETRVVVTHAGNNCISHNHGALQTSLVAPGFRANYTLAWCVEHALELCTTGTHTPALDRPGRTGYGKLSRGNAGEVL